MAGLSFRRSKRAHAAQSKTASTPYDPEEGRVVHTSYTSAPVSIPPSFLLAPPPAPPTVTRVDFGARDSPLPEYAGAYAVVLDGVLSEAECGVMLQLAQESAGGKDGPGWKPAMLNVGIGMEVLATDTRKCDRIIWDTQDLASRVFERCLLADGIKHDLETITGPPILHERQVERGERWKLVRPNERLRFLKYGVGHYFKSHCDGTFETPSGERSFYTLHLYLNTLPSQSTTTTTDSPTDSNSTTDFNSNSNSDGPPPTADGPPPPPISPTPPPSGGATTFLPRHYYGDAPPSRGLWVAPRAGRVLLFQHKGLLHDGEEVRAGLKVTMRTDLMYALDRGEEEEEEEED